MLKQNEHRKSTKSIIDGCKLKEETTIFDFIKEGKLKIALVKSHKKAVFIQNITKRMSINQTDAHPLNEIQILHYASIYEAIIDFILEKYYKNKIEAMLKVKQLLKVEHCKKITITELESRNTLFLAKEKTEKRKLFQIKFEARLQKAIDLELISPIKKKEYNWLIHL